MAPRLAADARRLNREQLVALRNLLADEAIAALLADEESRLELARVVALVDRRLKQVDERDDAAPTVARRIRIAAERRPTVGNAR